ncbi:MAG: hypothetical protein NC041_02970 [Bacteroides sp.]|nr:hypothetical protein [Prevotella sp.]MCM1408422.1 hypothetical protein [Treponema brennaborense]MCM1469416.1 hypothetical protein [Bacteroides sp.]
MKKSFNGVFALAAVLAVFAGCATTSNAEKTSDAKTASQKSGRFEIIDWNGAAFGSAAPADWMQYAEERDYSAFESTSAGEKVKNRFYVIVSGTRPREKRNGQHIPETFAGKCHSPICRGNRTRTEPGS